MPDLTVAFDIQHWSLTFLHEDLIVSSLAEPFIGQFGSHCCICCGAAFAKLNSSLQYTALVFDLSA